MDFFASQDAARRKTSRLLFYFTLAVLLIIIAIYLAIALVFFYQQGRTEAPDLVRFWNPELFVMVCGSTLLVVGLGSFYKIRTLQSGGARVAEMLGGRLIPADTGNFLEKRLLNIVEEMAIASGVPVPSVYLMENEAGINAFAAGFSQNDAVIGVTKGTLENLNREELQGVIAHEYSHILNGDMWLDLKIVGLLHGILLIAVIGRSILRGTGRSRSSKNSGGAVLMGLVLLVLGYIGVLFGRLIKSSVSRQREFLADASAVQFTRNPTGLAGALKKIGGLASGSLVKHHKAEEISHMFFSSGLKQNWLGLFATHPPLTERIVRLDPSFDGTFPQMIKKQPKSPPDRVSEKRKQPERISQGAAALAALAGLAAEPQKITGEIGAPVRAHMDYARELLQNLPVQVRAATGDPFGARAVIYGLLLDQSAEVRQHQLHDLKQSADQKVYEATEKLAPGIMNLAPEVRLPLMDLAMPSLRAMSFEQFRDFERNVQNLVRADSRISLFEFVLEYVVVRRLEKNFISTRDAVKVIGSVNEAAAEISGVLSLLANLGHDDQEAVKAFNAAAATLEKEEAGLLHYLTREECRKIQLPEIIERLNHLSSSLKKSLVAACFQSLVHDRTITMQEAEFFRLVVYALDLPIPPWQRT